MTIVLKNNVVGYLSIAISASDTVLRLRTNDGLKFPFLEALQYCYVTLSSGTQGDAMEIVKVTYRMNDNLQVVRAQEDTIAQAFPVGTKVELRVTAQSIKDAIGEVDVTSNVAAAQAAAASAQTSANAASGFSSTASAYADEAGSYAQAANTSYTQANTAYQGALVSEGHALTYRNEASQSASDASGSAAAASISQGTAASSASAAQGYRDQAQTSAGQASTYRTEASQSASDADGSRAAAQISATAAAASQFLANGSATDASNSASAAATSYSLANTAAGAAGASASASQGYSVTAQGYRDEAFTFRNTTEGYKNTAQGYRDEALTFRNLSESFADAAQDFSVLADQDSAAAAASATLSANYAKQGGASYIVSDFVADGLFWTTAFGGSPTTVADPPAAFTYVDVASVGRVARVSLSAGDYYLQPKSVFQPVVGRKYRVRTTAKVITDATGGGVLAAGIYINGLTSTFAHTDPSSDWTTTADGARPSFDNSFNVADGVVNFGVIFTCTAVSSGSAYWRPRFGMVRTGGAGGVIEVREFLIEEITDISTTNATITTLQQTVADGDSANATSITTLQSEYRTGSAFGANACSDSNFDNVDTVWTNRYTQSGALATFGVVTSAGLRFLRRQNTGMTVGHQSNMGVGASYAMPCSVGNRLELSAYVSFTNQTSANLVADFFNSSDAYIGSQIAVNSMTNNARTGGFVTAPVNAAKAALNVVAYCSAATNEYQITQPYMRKVNATQTALSPYERSTDPGTTAAITTEANTRAAADSAAASTVSSLTARVVTQENEGFGGQNLLPNTSWIEGKSDSSTGWYQGWVGNHGLSTSNGFVTNPDYTGTIRTYQVFVSGTPANGTVADGLVSSAWADLALLKKWSPRLRGGERLYVSSYMAGHRCQGRVIVGFFNDAGVYIDEVAFTGTYDAYSGLQGNPANFERVGGFFTAPAAARYLSVIHRAVFNGSGANPYLFHGWPMVAIASSTQTTAPAYNTGGMNAGSSERLLISEAAIVTEANTRAAADSAAASTVTSLTSTVTSNDAAARKINRNLIPNSTGLRGTTGWSNTASPGWGTYKHPLWGEWFYRVFTGLSGITEAFYTDAIPASAGITYHFSAVPFIAGLSSGDARIVMAFYNSSYGWISEQNIWLTSGMNELRQTSSAVAPAGTAYVRFIQQLINATGNAGYAEIGFWQAKIEFGGSTAWRADDELQNGLARLTVSEAAITTEANTRAAADAAAASTVTTLTARTDSMDAAMNSNPNFSLYTTTPGVPDLWGSWDGGESGTRVTGISPKPYAYRLVGVAGANRGIQQNLQNKLTIGWHVLEYDVTLNSGTFVGAGGHLNWGPSGTINASTNLSFQTDLDTSGVAPGNGTTGRLYKFRKLININTACVEGNIYAMAHWNGLGSVAAANDITFHRAAIRPASQAEIEARSAYESINTPTTGLTARITSAETAITTNNTATTTSINTLTTRVDSADANGSLLANPFFRIPFTNGTAPTGWVADSTQANSQFIARPYGMPGNCYYNSTAAGVQSMIYQFNAGGVYPGGKYKLGAQIARASGTLGTSGVFVAWFTDANVFIDYSPLLRFSTEPRTDGTTGATPDRVVRYEIEVTAPANAYRARVYAATGWGVWGSIEACAIYWLEVVFAPATISEAAIRTEASTRSTADSSLSSLITSLTAKVNVNSNRFPHPQPLDTNVPAGWAGNSMVIGTWQPLDGYFYYKARGSGGPAVTEYYYYDVDPPGGGAYMGGVQYTLSAVGYSQGVAGDSLQMRIELLDNSTGAIVDASPYVTLNSYDIRASTTTNYTGAEPYLRRRVVFMRTWASSGSYQDMVFNYIKLEAGTVATAYTAEGSSTTLQAGVTTNSSAIATVDGKLSASYGLTVDANGRIASMKLLSNGTTSEVAFRSDTFKVYNGASNDAVFEVSGGSVYIAALKVRTESMIANAVSQAYGNETDASYTVTTSYADIETVTVTVPTGAQVDIMWSFSLEGTATSLAPDGGDCYIQILRDSTVIYSETRVAHVDPYDGVAEYYDGGVAALLDFSIVKQSVSHPAGMDFDTPSAGTYTYKLQIKKSSGTWFASKRRMNAVLRKK